MAESKTYQEPARPIDADRREALLVAALLNRNRKAAAEFVALYADFVHAYVYQRLIPRTDLVDDIVQDVFLSAWDGLPRFGGRSSLKTWLLGIARHKVEDYYRKRLRELQFPDEGEDVLANTTNEPQFDVVIDKARAMTRTRAILEELPQSSSMLLLWRYWEKRSLKEMSEHIGKSEKAVERALARARQQFRQRWERANG